MILDNSSVYFFSAFLLLGIIAFSHASTLQGTIDLKRLEGILQDNLKGKDVSSLYFAVKGLKQLNAKIPNICEVSQIILKKCFRNK